jgi:hypothetical protein
MSLEAIAKNVSKELKAAIQTCVNEGRHIGDNFSKLVDYFHEETGTQKQLLEHLVRTTVPAADSVGAKLEADAAAVAAKTAEIEAKVKAAADAARAKILAEEAAAAAKLGK